MNEILPTDNIEKVEIGLATLYRGDCTQVAGLLDGFDHTITDPPYEAGAHTGSRQIMSSNGLIVQAHRFSAMDETTRKEITRSIAKKTSKWSLIFCQNEGAHFWREAFRSHGISPYSTMVWCKPDGKPNYNGTGPGVGYESIVSTWHGEGRSSWNGGGRTGIFIINKNEERDDGNIHTTIKPQKLMVELVTLFTNKEELIFDPFMGSGSTGVAAVSLGRRFVGIERDPEYFEICCRRIERAQQGLFSQVYVKTKARVASLFEPASAQRAIKIEKPKPRTISPARKFGVPEMEVVASGERSKAPTVEPKRFALPAVENKAASSTVVASSFALSEGRRASFIRPISIYQDILDKAGEGHIDLGPFDPTPNGPLGMDVESFSNFFLVCFKRFRTGEKIAFEMSERFEIDKELLQRIVTTNRIVTFNGATYDLPMLVLAQRGWDTYKLKQASDRIIKGSMRRWDVEKEFDIKLPQKLDHIDLLEPNPSIRQGLKTLAGRMHAKTMMDLPYDPDARLSKRDMNIVTVYCLNDLDHTQLLFDQMAEPLELRRLLSNQYKIDLRSKSDAQVGEAIIKVRVEKALGRSIRRAEINEHSFRYDPPSFVRFETEQLRSLFDKVRLAEYSIDPHSSKPVMPDRVRATFRIGATEYSFGQGGLHSTEGTRALYADDEHGLEDIDVSSQYPFIVLKLGLYPKALGPRFLDAMKDLVSERLAGKDKMRDLEVIGSLDAAQALEYGKARAMSEGGKIAVNGAWGKTGSAYSVLYCPQISIGTTLTGQLSLLMMIERAELRGIPVASANTDGILFRYPRAKRDVLDIMIREWEEETTFRVERTPYRAIYNSSVNVYMAVKEKGGLKRKGPIANPWAEGDKRGMMMKNPQMCVCSDAVAKHILGESTIEEHVRSCKDPRDFVTVINVKGGGEWRGEPIGRVARYYWSTDGASITYAGANRKVAKTDGAKPMLVLPDELPEDVDLDRYVQEAKKIAVDIGALPKEGLL